MAISILVPTIGATDYLTLFCNSVQQHTSVPYEILIWDNGRSDKVKEFCKSKEYRYFSSDKNLGITAPYNVMVQEAKYDLVFLADNDYYVLPGWDSIVENVGEVYWKRPTMIDPRAYMEGRSIVGQYGFCLNEFAEKQLLNDFYDTTVEEKLGTYMPPVMKRQDYINIGGFNEDFYVGETDFLWRAFCYYQSHEFDQTISTNSFIYHFGSKTDRPFSGGAESKRHNQFLIDTYGMDEQQLGANMGIF